jgi:hypothetical protein
MIDILNKNYEPSFDEITEYIDKKDMWIEINNHINSTFKSKPKMFYSRCSAKPGWNVKYKKSSKAICTLYPDKDYFTALVVLNDADMKLFDKNNFSKYLNDLYDNCSLFNNTKWLMIEIRNKEILNDVKKLMELKLGTSHE